MEEDIKILEQTIKLNGKRIQPEIINAMENLMSKAKEQEKIIELMADYIDLYGECVDRSKKNCEKAHCKECIIEFFRKKAKGE